MAGFGGGGIAWQLKSRVRVHHQTRHATSLGSLPLINPRKCDITARDVLGGPKKHDCTRELFIFAAVNNLCEKLWHFVCNDIFCCRFKFILVFIIFYVIIYYLLANKNFHL